MNIRQGQSQIVYILLWVLFTILVCRFTMFLFDAAQRHSAGFITYYTSSKLLIENADPARFYDRTWFQTQIEKHSSKVRDIYHANPPTMSLMLLPFVGFDYTTSRISWTLFNLAIIIGTGGWLLKQLNLKGIWLVGLATFFLVFQPIYANFHEGQAYVLMFGLLVVAYYGYRQENEILLGIALALMMILKTAGILLWVLIFVQRRWKALGCGIAFVFAIVLFSLPRIGLEAWKIYGQLLFELTSQPELSVTAYQTHLSFFLHLFTFNAQWNPSPILISPVLGNWLPKITFIIMLGTSSYYAFQTHKSDLIFASFAVLSIILSPVSQDYHYTMLLVPIVILIARTREYPSLWFGLILVIATVPIAVSFPYKSSQLTAGVWALFAYPKLYGGLILWIILLWMMWTKDGLLTEEVQSNIQEP